MSPNFINGPTTYAIQFLTNLHILTSHNYDQSRLRLSYNVIFQNALETWKQFMEKLRSDCPSLNFFTTDQLVTLSRDLAKFVHKKSKSLDTQSIMMLKCIAPLMENKDLLKFVLSHFPGASAQGKKISVTISTISSVCPYAVGLFHDFAQNF